MPAAAIPTLRDGDVTLRPIRARDAKPLERVLLDNRGWLRQWEATYPGGGSFIDTRASIRNLLAHARTGHALPFVIELRRRARRAAQRLVDHVRLALVGDDRLLGRAGGRRAAASRPPPSRSRPTTASRCCACTAWRSASGPRTSPSLRVVEKLGFRYEGLRRRFIHINGDWRDHFAFALVAEEVPRGVLRRWREGQVPDDAARVPAEDRAAAAYPLRVADR